MSWDRVSDPNDILSEGQQVKVKVVKIDVERNLVYLHGCVPGHVNSYLVLHSPIKNDRDLSEKPGMTVSNAAAKAMVGRK